MTDSTGQQQDDQAENTTYMRRIRSFVLREGRLTKGQQRSLELFWPTMGLEYQPQPYDFTQVFGRNADLVLEIGFGMGETTAKIAALRPSADVVAQCFEVSAKRKVRARSWMYSLPLLK